MKIQMIIKKITTLNNIAFWLAISFYVLVAYVMRQSGLNPNSLWLDDQWVATLIKTQTWLELFTVHVPIPIGFALILKFFHSIISDPEFSLQIFPFFCGLVQIPLIAILGKQLTGRYSIGLIMAFLLVFSPEISTYSLRVKTYTLDSLIIICLILGQVNWLKTGKINQSGWYCFFSSLALFFSFTSVLVSFILVNLPVVMNYIKEKNTKNIITYTIGYNIFLFLVYYFLLRHQSNPAMKEFWSPEFLPINDIQTSIVFINNNFLSLFTNSVHPDLRNFLIIIPLSVLLLLLGKTNIRFGIFVVLFFFLFLVLSGLRVYPIGGIRTDIFSYPVVIIMIGLGFNMVIIHSNECLIKLVRRSRNVIAMIQLNNLLKCTDIMFILAVILCSTWFINTRVNDRYYYVSNEDKKAVYYLNDNLPDNSGLIIYPHAMWAVGYYGRWATENIYGYRNNVGVAHNFDTHIKRSNTLNFSTMIDGNIFTNAPNKNIKIVNEYLKDDMNDIYLLITSPNGKILNPILSAIESRNYELEEVIQFHPHTYIRHYDRK